ncbi:beta-galactosidase trimerization domain-containing protein, partial [Staphylococcus aureus]|uniref:beta-galactosidase trimerization domain-containing protein n=1 Tax=Staphylococcus aureus TaxID=1280 RepID=UPI00338DBE19
HSGLVPHAGTDTDRWREVVELGRTLEAIAEVAGSGARNDVAMVLSWDARWGAELNSHPTADLRYLDQPHAWYRALWDR